jgi:hypothetical protein
MSDDTEVLDFAQHRPHLRANASKAIKEQDADSDSCPAFGFLRGLDSRALAVEFRYQNGNSDWFPYSWLGPWRFNPSVGLLLKFMGDVVTLVMIRGSNLDMLVGNSAVNLTDRGFQRHRILWVREMAAAELQGSAASSPSVDRLDVAEFESNDELREWLKITAPGFLRNNSG